MLFVQLLLQGLQVGAIYALTAAGFALIFGATRIFHFAHGSSFALAGYVFIFAMQAGWPWWMGGLAATLTATLFGIGWGIAGICPGPALVLLGTGAGKGIVFVLAMLAGMLVFELWDRISKRSH